MSAHDFPFSELRTSIKSFRLFAIDLAFREGASSEILSALEQQAAREEDDECKVLLRQAIDATRARLNGVSPEVSPSAANSGEVHVDRYLDLSDQERAALLASLTAEQRGLWLPCVPEMFHREPHPLIAARLLKTFGAIWPAELLPVLLERLDDSSLALRLAVLDTLIRRAPESLKPRLSEMLTSPDPGMRSQAIRALTRIDKDEAIEQLRQLLLSPDHSLRLAGLQNCLYLPFTEIQDLMIAYLAGETDGELIERAGLLFAINPDPRLPFHLWELMATASPEKGAHLRRILELSCQLLKDSEILGDRYAVFQKKLQDYIDMKSAHRFVQQCLDHLLASPETWMPDRYALIQRGLKKPLIRETFKKALEWPITDHARQAVGRLLQGEAPQNQDASVSTTNKPTGPAERTCAEKTLPPMMDFSSLALDQQLREVSLWEVADKPVVSGRISSLINSPQTNVALAAAAFRAAIRLEDRQFLAKAEECVASGDSNLVTASLEYLAFAAFDRVVPIIGRFLHHPQPRLRSTAVQLLKRVDPHQALAAVQLLLQSRDEDKQESALACLIYFEFPLVRDVLTSYLRTCRSKRALERGLCLFQANPDLENLYSLFLLEQVTADDSKAEIAKASVFIESAILECGMVEPGVLQQFKGRFAERLARMQARATPKPLSSTVTEPPFTDRLSLTGLYACIVAQRNVLLTGVVGVSVILAGSWFLFSSPPSEKTVVRGTPLIAEPYQTVVVPIEVDLKKGGVILEDTAQNRFLVFPRQDGFALPGVGGSLRVRLIPFRRGEKGIIHARIQEISNP